MSLLTNPWMQVGMGLLANSGPSLTPVNPWKGIGQGLMAANEAKVAETEQEYLRRYRQQQENEWKRADEKRGYLDSMVAAETDPQLAAMARVAPDKYVERKLSGPVESAQMTTAGQLGLPGLPPETPVEVKMKGGQVVDYNVAGQGQASLPADIQGFNLAREQGYQGSWMDYQRESAEMGRQQRDYSLPISTPEGMFVFDTRTKQVSPMMGPNGTPLVKATDSPELQGDIAGSRKAEEIRAGAQAQAQVDLPQKEATADQTIKLVKELRDHPGMPGVVGLPDNPMALRGMVPGTNEANFKAGLEQLQGQQFLQAYETLKGSGQITEIEGTKAQNAIARMQTSQSEAAFKKAADDFVEIIEGAVGRAKKKAGQGDDYQYVPGKGLVKQ